MVSAADILASSSTAASSSGSTSMSQADQAKQNFIGTQDQFLKILLAQLKHQDPLEPMKGTEFIDSITRLSSVEQAVNQNQNLEKIVNLLQGKTGGQLGSPVSYLDKDIEFKSSDIALQGGLSHFFYNLTAATDQVDVSVKDESGRVVFTGKGSNKIGKNPMAWDGTDNNGNQLKDGKYTVDITYKGSSDLPVSVQTYTSGIVDSARFDGDDVLLGIGSITTTLDKVTAIHSMTNVATTTN